MSGIFWMFKGQDISARALIRLYGYAAIMSIATDDDSASGGSSSRAAGGSHRRKRRRRPRDLVGSRLG
ncbi:hypothetical protein MRX96_041836 [Rhipicephalus microplus]